MKKIKILFTILFVSLSIVLPFILSQLEMVDYVLLFTIAGCTLALIWKNNIIPSPLGTEF